MSALEDAIRLRNWELASLCLLIALAEVISRVPSDSVEGLLDVIDGGDDGRTQN
jgi:hypothetical protein